MHKSQQSYGHQQHRHLFNYKLYIMNYALINAVVCAP